MRLVQERKSVMPNSLDKSVNGTEHPLSSETIFPPSKESAEQDSYKNSS